MSRFCATQPEIEARHRRTFSTLTAGATPVSLVYGTPTSSDDCGRRSPTGRRPDRRCRTAAPATAGRRSGSAPGRRPADRPRRRSRRSRPTESRVAPRPTPPSAGIRQRIEVIVSRKLGRTVVQTPPDPDKPPCLNCGNREVDHHHQHGQTDQNARQPSRNRQPTQNRDGRTHGGHNDVRACLRPKPASREA